MSTHKSNKEKNVKNRQAVMGDFFSKSDKSKKSTKTSEPNKTIQTVKEREQKATEKVNPEKNKVSEKGHKLDSKLAEKKTESEEKKSIEKKSSLKRKVTGAGMFTFSWTRGAQRDTEEYRNGYPGKTDYPDLDDNYRFYMNQTSSKPDGDLVDKIHVNWWGDYRQLEVHHGYIQWLFPIRDTGLNWHAQELQLHEIKKLQKSRKAMKRIITSYKMMLDFYGMKLENEDDGTIVRAENWRDRFRHLNRSYHNYLRITRILKSLGEFGYEHLKGNFVKFVLQEGMVEGTLSNLIDSCVKYWIGVLKEEDEREGMFDYYEKLLEEETRFSKRRSRSPSPDYSRYLSNSTTASKSLSNSDKDGKVKKKEKNVEKGYDNKTVNVANKNEVSDDEEDGTLYYAMSLIDEDMADASEFEVKKDKDIARQDHEISDSDEEGAENQGESQEMAHWNKESKQSSEDNLVGGSESYNSITGNDVIGRGDVQKVDSVEQKERHDDSGKAEVKNKDMPDVNKDINMDEVSGDNMDSQEIESEITNIERDNVNEDEKNTNKGNAGDNRDTRKTIDHTDNAATKQDEMDTSDNRNGNKQEHGHVGHQIVKQSKGEVKDECKTVKSEDLEKPDVDEEMETL